MYSKGLSYYLYLYTYHTCILSGSIHPVVESEYSLLGSGESNDTGPSASVVNPPELPAKQSGAVSYHNHVHLCQHFAV